MNDRQLRYACAVWRERSFSQAAKALAVSQPSISEQVRLLEEELGFPLFHRGARGVEARTVGEAFLEKAEQTLNAMGNLEMLARQLRGDGKVRLRIGINSGIDRGLLTRAMAIISAEFSEIRYDVVTATSRRILRLVDQDRLDLGFLIGAEPEAASPKIASWPLGSIEIAAFVAASHPLASSEGPVAFAEIARQPLIITDAYAGVGHLVFALFAEHDLIPRIVADSDNIDTVMAMVASGMGIALLPTSAFPATDDVHVVAITGRPRARIDLIHAMKAKSPVAEIGIARLRAALH